MSSPDQAPIVVGVDGAPATDNAIRYAVSEAAAVGAPVRLVHVVASLRGEPAYAAVDRDALLARGRAILRASAGTAHAAAPQVPIHTELHHGARKFELALAACGAAKIVIGGTHLHSIGHVRTGSMAVALVEHASCPVIVVPDGWRAEPGAPVLVGYKSPDASFDALARGFELAADSGRSLVVLHAWHLPTGYDDTVSAHVRAANVEQHAKEAIESLIADLRTTHPEVHSRIWIRHGQPAHALIEASHHAVALVLARPVGDHMLAHLGSTARAVLRHSACPVVFGATGPAATSADLVIEPGGHMER